MARRRGIFRRNSDSEGGDGDASPTSPSPEDDPDLASEGATDEPARGGRLKAWLGYCPEPESEEGTQAGRESDPPSMPATQEWQVNEPEPEPDAEHEEPETEMTTSNPEPPDEEPEQMPPEPGEPPSRRGDTAERIRVAAAAPPDAAEQRSIEEILALEEDLERARIEAATKLEELE